MRENHSNLFMPIFAITIVLLLGLFVLTIPPASADQGYKGKGRNTEWQKQKKHNKGFQKQGPEARREIRDRRDYNRRPDYHQHRGYRERPYDQRQYRHHDYKGHRYNYEGHWRSWDQWDRYAKNHPEIIKHGEYYRENAHLMFRFRDPITGNSLFFSIGR